jgi:hypothetical protein
VRSRPDRRRGRLRNALLVTISALLLKGGLYAVHGTWAALTGSSPTAGSTLSTISMQPPTALTAATHAAGGVTLAWTASSSAALRPDRTFTYLVFRSAHGAASYAQLNSAPGTTALTYTDTPPGDGTYDYVAQTYVSNFTSPNSGLIAGLSDRTPPTVSVTCNGAACQSTYVLTSVTVKLTAADAGSGPASITYWVNGGSHTTVNGSTASFTQSGVLGSYTVSYFATDVAGNIGSTQTVTFSIIL